MNKLKMHSESLVEENIEKIKSLFPNCITEGYDSNGKQTKLVDFDLLKQELSHSLVEGNDERYTLCWAGKKEALLQANMPISATLRPCREDSVNFDTTKNLYIEGDNLQVLKLLRETYLGAVKMIYIDPPYNTGNDLMYNDDFTMETQEYLLKSKQIDEQGVKLTINNENNGKFHTDWLNLMYPRLKVAFDLLSKDGVMFVSIDDNEIDNLLKLVKEIFNENNLVNVIAIKTNETKGLKNSNVNKSFPKNKEYLVIVAKNKELVEFNIQKIKKSESELKQYIRYYNKYIENIENDCSKWEIKDFNTLTKELNEQEIYDLKMQYKDRLIYFVSPDNFDEEKVPDGCNKFYKFVNSKGVTIYIYRDFDGEIKNTLFLEDNLYKNLGDLWTDISTININKEICDMPTYANGQKPIKLLERLINYMVNKNENAIIMDFFAGSSTTAHAVLNLNM